MKEETFNEGWKELMAILGVAVAVPMAANKVIDIMDRQSSSNSEKIQAIQQADTDSDDPFFDKVSKDLIDHYQEKPKSQPEKKVIPREIKYPDVTIRDLDNFLRGYEISKNKPHYEPYQDDNRKKLWTVGIGHLIGDGSLKAKEAFVKKYGPVLNDKQVREIYDKDLTDKLQGAKRAFGEQWVEFSPNLKLALGNMNFRGELYNPKGPKSYIFVQLLKQRKFKEAANEYLYHNKEYAKRMKLEHDDGSIGDSVTHRMERHHKIMLAEKPFTSKVVKK